MFSLSRPLSGPRGAMVPTRPFRLAVMQAHGTGESERYKLYRDIWKILEDGIDFLLRYGTGLSRDWAVQLDKEGRDRERLVCDTSYWTYVCRSFDGECLEMVMPFQFGALAYRNPRLLSAVLGLLYSKWSREVRWYIPEVFPLSVFRIFQ